MRRGDVRLIPALLALGALGGCDPTSGLADTANAALPSVKRYFDGPGQKLSAGPWNRVVVDLDAGTSYHLGARRLDDDDPTFHLFGVDVQDGCQISPNAGTWLMGKPDAAPFRLLPYLESSDERGRGRLRFTTVDCEVQDIAIEDAGRPYPRLYDQGYLVPTKRGYTFVDPWSGTSREIAEHLQAALVWDESVLLWADGELKTFTEQFEPKDTLGDGVVAVVAIDEDFLMEDRAGLWRVAFDRETRELTSSPVLEGACRLQVSRLFSSDEAGPWIALAEPCENPKPSLVHLDRDSFELLEKLELPFEADAHYARSLVGGASEEGPEPLSFLYLTDVDEDGRGSLWASRSGTAEPILLGERAELDAVFLASENSDWDGVAHTNYQLLGDYMAYDRIRFRWDGTTEPAAERIVRNTSSGELLVNFDGVAGDVPTFEGDELLILAEGVPPYLGEASSFTTPRRQARMDHFDGQTGRVLLNNDFDNAEAQLPLEPPLWDPLAHGVPPESLRFSWFMPALMFLENWDAETNTGALVAYNYELDARATISEGVSSFDLTSYPWEGVVYAVPYGERRGIWFSKAK